MHMGPDLLGGQTNSVKLRGNSLVTTAVYPRTLVGPTMKYESRYVGSHVSPGKYFQTVRSEGTGQSKVEIILFL